MTVRLLGVFIRKESQRCVRQVSPIPRRSRTRWHTSARFNALLTPSPAQPAPTTTAARVSGLLVIVRKISNAPCASSEARLRYLPLLIAVGHIDHISIRPPWIDTQFSSFIQRDF